MLGRRRRGEVEVSYVSFSHAFRMHTRQLFDLPLVRVGGYRLSVFTVACTVAYIVAYAIASFSMYITGSSLT